MTNQLKIGVILSYINIGVSSFIGLIYTPLMIHFLGQAEYGLYSLIGSLVAYLSILDLGLGNSIVRYIARNRAIGDKCKEYELNGMFLSLYFVVGVITLLIGSLLYFYLDDIFGYNLSPVELSKAKMMTGLLVFNFSLSFPLSTFSSIMQAHERFIVLRICNLLRTVLNPIFVLPALLLGYGSVMVVVVSTFLNISFLLVNAYYCFKYLDTKFILKNIDYSLLREIAGYTFFIFLNLIMDKLYWSTGQIILGKVSGINEVAVYSIAVQIITIYSSLSMVLTSVLLPKITMMIANGISSHELSQIMIKTGRLQFIVLSYILSLFIICGKSFILLWVGSEFLEAYYIVTLLMCSLLISLIQTVGISILQAKNMNGFRTVIYVIAAFMNVAISIPLARNYGGIGCAIGISLALLISTGLIINLYYYYKIGINIPLFWKNIISMSFPVLSVIVIGIIFNQFAIDNFWLMLVKFLIFSLLFIITMYMSVMNQYEKDLILKPFFRLYIKLNNKQL